MRRGRKREINLTYFELKDLLKRGYSYSQIAYLYSCTREAIYYYAKKWNLRELNLHKKYRETIKRGRVPRVNSNLKPNCYLDITEISFRYMRGKHKRCIRRYFLGFKNAKKLYLYYMRDRAKRSILLGEIKLSKYFPKPTYALVDIELLPLLPENPEIVYVTTEEWHCKKSLIEKHFGFKTCVYAPFKFLKSSPYSKLTPNDIALLLKLYLRSANTNKNIQVVNPEDIEEDIRALESEAKIALQSIP